MRNGTIERSIRASMNYNSFVDYQFALAHLSHPGRDVCALSRTISLRSHKSCHALKTRRIPTSGMESEHRVWFYAIRFVSIVMNC